MSYSQFTRDTRVKLAILLNASKTQVECAKILGMDRSTVCLEINRNKDPDGVYRGGHAHRRFLERRQQGKRKYRKIENDRRLRRHIVRKVKLLWSPEQIAGRLKLITGHVIICHETIYTFIYEKRPDLAKYLRHGKCKYRKKRGSRARMERNRATKIRSIEERPELVLTRTRYGDWEDDTIVGKERADSLWEKNLMSSQQRVCMKKLLSASKSFRNICGSLSRETTALSLGTSISLLRERLV